MYHLNIVDDIIPNGAKYQTICSLDTCETQESKPTPLAAKVKARKGNDNMYVEQNMTVTEKTAEDSRRTHFLDEIAKIFSSKNDELCEKFGVDRPRGPKTPKELVEWIKGGDWSYIKSYDPEDDDSWCYYESPISGFRWTKIKEDRKGYDAAYKELIADKGKFVNEIWAEVDPANFIKIIEGFKKSKLH